MAEIVEFKDNQWFRSRLRKAGVTKHNLRSDRNYTYLISRLHSLGWLCAFNDVEELHKAISRLK